MPSSPSSPAPLPATAPEAPGRVLSLSPLQAFALPLGFILALAAFALSPAAEDNGTLMLSFAGAAALLASWAGVLLWNARTSGRRFTLSFSARKQHWAQAIVQLSIYAYWGYHWRPVYNDAPLIASQLFFAYAFDILLAWSRRDSYTLSFGPIPIIFSTNLFLWFKPDWFYLQFLLVGVGFTAKELIRWTRDGRSTHIFNPSTFPLALFSIALLITGNTDKTLAPEVATTLFYPPQMYLFIFFCGLPGQLFFGVGLMTIASAMTVYLFGVTYFALTGTYYFFDCYIPIAVFLGMHLLLTDPSTAPRTETGRILFGVLYGIGVIIAFEILDQLHFDTFYDKLLVVPLLNVCVRAIDGAVDRGGLQRFELSKAAPTLRGIPRNLIFIGTWAACFGAISLAGGLGDAHPGTRTPFWEKACAEGRPRACHNFGVLTVQACYKGSPWACNEVAILVADKKIRIEPTAEQLFARSCEMGLAAACANEKMVKLPGDHAWEHGAPRAMEYGKLIVTKGLARPKSDKQLLQYACDQGWEPACKILSKPPDKSAGAL